MFNLETSRKLLDAPKNEYSNTFVSILNPNIMQHLNLAQQIVHTMAHAKTRTANNAAAAYSSHHFRIFYSNENYLAAMSTANAHLIQAHRFVVNEIMRRSTSASHRATTMNASVQDQDT